MSKKSKRDIILEEIIKAYLEQNAPIGSSVLNSRMQIPASTIRVYFKKLSSEGVLTQLHISGGRIPTNEAMKNYWQNKLDTSKPVNIQNQEVFTQLVEDFGIYCMISSLEEEYLQEIINVQNRFLMLIIGKHQIILEYNSNVLHFLEDIKGVKLSDLKKISLHVGLNELHEKIQHLIATQILFKQGETIVYDIEKLNDMSLNFDVNFIQNLHEGLFFEDILPDGYMAVKKLAFFKGVPSYLFCLGELYTDFESFFTKTKEIA